LDPMTSEYAITHTIIDPAKHATIGLIGGTGVYKIAGLQITDELDLDTPFGKPSSRVHLGTIGEVRIAFIARHDVGHRLLPSEIPFRANIYALKMVGVKYLLSFSGVGSLDEKVKPMDLILVDQHIDRTKGIRDHTFFGQGIVAHVAMGEPVCKNLTSSIETAVKESTDPLLKDVTLHIGGTYICIEGPTFSSKAESNMYRQLGGTVIGMTAIPELLLAKEAEIAYAMVGLVTDYDCWHPAHDAVTVDMVMATLHKNAQVAQAVLAAVIKKVGKEQPHSSAHTALKHAIVTPPERITEDTKRRLGYIIGKYLPK